MALVTGKTLVVRLDDGAAGFDEIIAAKSDTFTGTANRSDATGKTDAPWGASVPTSSFKTFVVSGTAILDDAADAGYEKLVTEFFAADPSFPIQAYEGSASLDRIVGTFMPTSISVTGGVEETAEYSFTLRNTGAVTREADV